jgi:hypothetical protein
VAAFILLLPMRLEDQGDPHGEEPEGPGDVEDRDRCSGERLTILLVRAKELG